MPHPSIRLRPDKLKFGFSPNNRTTSLWIIKRVTEAKYSHLFVVTASPIRGTWGDTRQNRFVDRGRDMLQDSFDACSHYQDCHANSREGCYGQGKL